METYKTKRRIHKEGLSEEIYQEGLINVQQKMFGSMPLFGGRGAKDPTRKDSSKPALGDFDRYSTTWVFSVIFGRGVLNLKERTACILTAQTALQRLDLVRIFVNACLNVGWSEDEIREIIIWTNFCIGFPAMRTAGMIAHDVFEKRKEEPSSEMG